MLGTHVHAKHRIAAVRLFQEPRPARVADASSRSAVSTVRAAKCWADLSCTCVHRAVLVPDLEQPFDEGAVPARRAPFLSHAKSCEVCICWLHDGFRLESELHA